MEKVIVFIRRLGLKVYAAKFREYEVDGKALVLLDDEDFDNMEISSRIHRKKIRVEVDRIFVLKDVGTMLRDHDLRREKIRKAKLYKAAAITLQVFLLNYSIQMSFVIDDFSDYAACI